MTSFLQILASFWEVPDQIFISDVQFYETFVVTPIDFIIIEAKIS